MIYTKNSRINLYKHTSPWKPIPQLITNETFCTHYSCTSEIYTVFENIYFPFRGRLPCPWGRARCCPPCSESKWAPVWDDSMYHTFAAWSGLTSSSPNVALNSIGFVSFRLLRKMNYRITLIMIQLCSRIGWVKYSYVDMSREDYSLLHKVK